MTCGIFDFVWKLQTGILVLKILIINVIVKFNLCLKIVYEWNLPVKLLKRDFNNFIISYLYIIFNVDEKIY